MAHRRLLTIDTGAYRRTHGMSPQAAQPRKGLWAFCIDDAATVVVKYGTYTEALAWAKHQAQATVTVLP